MRYVFRKAVFQGGIYPDLKSHSVESNPQRGNYDLYFFVSEPEN